MKPHLRILDIANQQSIIIRTFPLLDTSICMRRCLLACLLFCPVIPAMAGDLQSLLSKSPFEGTTSNSTVSTAVGPLEFRGVVRTGQNWSFCVYNVQAKTSAWVGMQELGQTYFVKSYDPAKETIQVEFSQNTYTLPLRIATTPVAVAQPPGGSVPMPVRPNGGASTGPVPIPGAASNGPTVISDPNGAESPAARDMRNLERLAREAARLRAERARNLNSNPPPKQ